MLRFLALCIAMIATASGLTNELDVHEQCKLWNYRGACIELPLDGIYPSRCGNLLCAKAVGDGTYTAHGIGPAYDGTYCGSRKACRAGRCTVPIRRLSAYGKDAKYHCKDLPRMISYSRPKGQKSG